MIIDAAFPSQYLKMVDLQGRTVRVVIDRFVIEEIGDGERKPVLYFVGKEKGLVLNRVNADTISGAYGSETDGWSGQTIELYADPNVYFGPKKVGGLRVRVPRIAAPAPLAGPATRPPTPVQHRAEVQYTEDNPPPIDDDEIPF